MSAEPRSVVGPNVVVGLGIIGLGVALLLDRMGLLSARDLLQYWPVLLVLFGASIVWQAIWGRVGADGRIERPIVSPGLVLLLIIVSVVATRGDWRRANQSVTSAADAVAVSAVLGESRQTNTSARFRSADMTAILGGSVLDLRQTTIPDGEEAVIEVFAVMGGIDLFVPRHWQVVPEVVPVMGGVEDRRAREAAERARRARGQEAPADQPADQPAAGQRAVDTPAAPQADTVPTEPATSANPPRLIIRGFIMMGGLDIRS
jgi:hypothetical protein